MQSKLIKPSTTCCLYGFTADIVPYGLLENSIDCTRLKVQLATQIQAMVDKGVTTFISTLERGAAIYGAQIVLDLKRTHPEKNLKLVVMLSCPEQSEKWPILAREQFQALLEQADLVLVQSEAHHQNARERRNRAMLGYCGHMIAVFEAQKGKPGAVRLAESRGLDVCTLDPNDVTNKKSASA